MTNLDLYAPFDAGPGSNVTEDTWRKFMRHMLGSASGVIRGFDSEFAVFGDSSGMQVKAGTGVCWMRGHYGESTSQKTLSISAAHATLARKDRIVLRADFLGNVIGVERLTGTAAASPTAPAVTQNASTWETSLAVVDVAAAAVTITAAAVTDDRVFTTANAKYVRRGTAPVQSIATGTLNVPLTFTEIDYRSGDVTHDVSASQFTLNRAGLWTVVARTRLAANGTGARDLRIIDSDDITLIYGAQTIPGISTADTNISCVAGERFPAGKKISAVVWQNSGVALDAKPSDITFTWTGP